MKKKLAIIGASYLQLPLVEKAKQLKLHTLCFAWEKGAICKDICDEFFPISVQNKEKILDVCKMHNIDGVVSIASDVAVPTVNYIASNLNLIGNSLQCSLNSTNKFLMRSKFQENNLPIPRFIRLDNSYNIKDIDSLALPVIVKPVDRSGSLGINVVKSHINLESAIDASFLNEAIVEQFIEGEEISVETVSENGEHKILAMTDKVTTGFPHFVELQHHQPSKYTFSDLNETLTKIVFRGLDALDIKNGASHSEFIITPQNEVYITEIGSRMGGDFIGSDLVLLSTGYDFLGAVIRISLGEKIEEFEKLKLYSGIYFYTAKSKEVKKYVNDGGQCVIKSSFSEIIAKKISKSSDRSGYFIYQAETKIKV
jgi:biotin carboxylase